jgi:hypothetical protein
MYYERSREVRPRRPDSTKRVFGIPRAVRPQLSVASITTDEIPYLAVRSRSRHLRRALETKAPLPFAR